MDIQQIRCFLAVAEALHFGRAAQAMDMLPASLSRQIRLLEDRFETRLFLRTTRNVALTEAGLAILDEARTLVAQADRFEQRIRAVRRSGTAVLKVGAIDSAAAGLMPQLLQLLREQRPGASPPWWVKRSARTSASRCAGTAASPLRPSSSSSRRGSSSPGSSGTRSFRA